VQTLRAGHQTLMSAVALAPAPRKPAAPSPVPPALSTERCGCIACAARVCAVLHHQGSCIYKEYHRTCLNPVKLSPSHLVTPLQPRQHQERQGLTPLWEAGPGGAGAVWDIWRAGDVDVLRAYLRGHITSFINKGHRLQSGQVRGVKGAGL
jgi:hypothetical protein